MIAFSVGKNLKRIYSEKVHLLKAVGLLLFFLFFHLTSFSQTVFWTETFDGSVCAAGSGCDPSLVVWTTTNTGTNGSKANKFYVSCRENGNAVGDCGSGCGNDQTLHLGNVSTSSAAAFFCPSGDCGAAYDASSNAEVTNKRCESPTVSCAGKSGIALTFKYIEGGEGNFDNATCWYFDGSTWAQLGDMGKTATGCFGQGIWTQYTISLPASANNNANVKVGFRWVNNGNGAGSDPSFAVNDVQLTNTTILPIELISFTGEGNEKGVELKWETVTEINNDYFSVERSSDGENFEAFSIIQGAENSQQVLKYSCIDYSPFSDITYYRLKQVDYNGDYSYSNIIAVRTGVDNKNEVMIFPNPTSERITLIAQTEITYIRFYDLAGKLIYTQNVSGINSALVDVSEYPSGIYVVETDPGGKPEKEKLIIQSR